MKYEEDKILQIWNCCRKLNEDERKELNESIEYLSRIRRKYFSTYSARQKKFLSFEDIVENFIASKENCDLKPNRRNFPSLPTEEIADIATFVRLNLMPAEPFGNENLSRILQALTIRFTIRAILEKLTPKAFNIYFQLADMSRHILDCKKIEKRTDLND